ncbi:arabinosyltransferase domain-containing protein [Geodermatophilus nigrescens]
MTAADRDVLRPEVRDGSSPGGRSPSSARLWLTLVTSVLAVLGALTLPFAPVVVEDPVVTWPQDPGTPVSTSLLLNDYTPRTLDVRFSCAAARAAEAAPGGVVVATVQPAEPDAEDVGLVVTAAGGRLTVRSGGEPLVDEPVPAGACAYRVTGEADALSVQRDGRTLAVAPSEDGTDTGTGTGTGTGTLPDVDALVTSLEGVTGLGPADLSVTVRVSAPFTHSPAPVKVALLVTTAVAAALSAASLAGARRRRGPPAPGRWRPGLTDLAVLGILLAWVFLAPATDDDGYYSAMARNVDDQGYVAQYYQLRNQSFTPFTWFYYALAKWQAVGVSPVLLRVPALVAGVATYLVLRTAVARWVARRPAEDDGGRRPARSAPAVLAVTFLAWWLPYDMGVRPEAMVPALSAGVLVTVWSARERGSLGHVGLALGLAAVSCTVHPTGFVALAPLLVGAGGLWRVVRAGSARAAAARLGSVLAAPLALASTLAFVDGTFYDFVRSQEIFLSIQEQTTWYQEIERYTFLLSPIPMGSYAKRAAVLLGLLCLVWFAALAAAARARGVRGLDELRLAGWSLALGFALLLVTPSKWTHHFGALAGLGPLFLTLFLLSVPVLVDRVTAGRGPALPVGLAAVGSTAVVAALAMHGPNAWAYSWMLGVPHSFDPPFLGPVSFDSLLVWLVLAGVCTALAARRQGGAPRTRAVLRAAPALVLTCLAVVLVHLVGGFGYAAAVTWDAWSPQAAALRDPLARECGAAEAVVVADDTTARALPPLATPSGDPAGPFTADGWFPLDPPSAAVGAAGVLGSLTGPGTPGLGGTPETTTGTAVSAWSRLPAEVPADRVPLVMAAGRLEAGNELVVEYGRADPQGGVDVVLREPLVDGADTVAWRSFALRTGSGVPGGADAVRLVARDGTTDPGGWLAFSVPMTQRLVGLQELVGDAPTAVSWQFAFQFPCAVQPVVQHGITQPVQYGIVWGVEGTSGLDDNVFQPARGGLFGQLERTAGTVRLLAGVAGRPDVRLLQVYRFQQPLPADAYDLTVGRETVSGLTGPG